MKKVNAILLLVLWASITAFAWFLPARDFSDAERRPLAQKPEITVDSLVSGKFMVEFEDYSLDQFPWRDGFRTVKSLFHYYVLGQKDNNGIYLSDGYAAKQEYPLREESIQHAVSRFTHLYEKYLAESRVFMTIVPDKGYYLAENSGHLLMDYDKMFTSFAAGLPWATQIDLRETLSIENYYRTDTHWRQETLLPAADKICQAMGVTGPKEADFTKTEADRPFYGVYYGQAALPMEPDRICLMNSPLLENCTVYDHESGKTLPVYDETRLSGKDPYEVYLSGSRGLLTIKNPGAKTDKELIVFRDSFGSAMIPLLIQDYREVTVVDIRYVQIDLLDRFIDFHGQDVLLLYSTLVLNNSSTIK